MYFCCKFRTVFHGIYSLKKAFSLGPSQKHTRLTCLWLVELLIVAASLQQYIHNWFSPSTWTHSYAEIIPEFHLKKHNALLKQFCKGAYYSSNLFCFKSLLIRTRCFTVWNSHFTAPSAWSTVTSLKHLQFLCNYLDEPRGSIKATGHTYWLWQLLLWLSSY